MTYEQMLLAQMAAGMGYDTAGYPIINTPYGVAQPPNQKSSHNPYLYRSPIHVSLPGSGGWGNFIGNMAGQMMNPGFNSDTSSSARDWHARNRQRKYERLHGQQPQQVAAQGGGGAAGPALPNAPARPLTPRQRRRQIEEAQKIKRIADRRPAYEEWKQEQAEKKAARKAAKAAEEQRKRDEAEKQRIRQQQIEQQQRIAEQKRRQEEAERQKDAEIDRLYELEDAEENVRFSNSQMEQFLNDTWGERTAVENAGAGIGSLFGALGEIGGNIGNAVGRTLGGPRNANRVNGVPVPPPPTGQTADISAGELIRRQMDEMPLPPPPGGGLPPANQAFPTPPATMPPTTKLPPAPGWNDPATTPLPPQYSSASPDSLPVAGFESPSYVQQNLDSISRAMGHPTGPLPTRPPAINDGTLPVAGFKPPSYVQQNLDSINAMMGQGPIQLTGKRTVGRGRTKQPRDSKGRFTKRSKGWRVK